MVDDEPDILEIISYNLQKEGYKVYTADNGIEAIKKASKIKPDLIILDVMMPDMDGIEVCEHIRNTPSLQNTLITFLTARTEDYSLACRASSGAQMDYLTKPIKPKVLIGKIKSLIRRLPQKDNNDSILKISDIYIDRNSYTVIKKNTEIVLAPKEFELLYLLTKQPGKVFKREDILSKIWGDEVVVGSRTIDVHIRKLREKIGDEYFKTLKGIGYKFVLPKI